ncbi:unnamed protein product [Polarella glacialis]|uniref:Fe2OG dioxygenase domain-containing protein n=1 Tax=Polarella glacialis TaxID=89957 RepID=A0A813I2T5_POLGL|nr:unnamed protein product [Polarella glacialis]
MCSSIIASARESKMKPSGQAAGLYAKRTSSRILLEDIGNVGVSELCKELEAFTGCSSAHIDAVDVVHYGPGQEFGLHLDNCRDHEPGCMEELEDWGGRRIWSVVVYLNSEGADFQGGKTCFPIIGQRITPVQGQLLMFSNLHAGQVDENALHCSEPIQDGEKWVLTTWVREGVRLSPEERMERHREREEMVGPEDPIMTLAKQAAAEHQRALIQYNIVDRKLRGGGSTPIIVAMAHIPLCHSVFWSRPDCGEEDEEASLLRPLFAGIYPLCARFPCRRVVLDALMTDAECKYFVCEADDIYGDPIFDEDPDENECAVARSDWGDHLLNDLICSRVCNQIHQHFDDHRPLFFAGALLTRTRPENNETDFQDHLNCQIDKANIGCYDYSAVVCLTTLGLDFEGGQFIFNDRDGDEILEPRSGRCVLFASGSHLHQFQPVASGSRVTISMWFTLTGECGTSLPEPIES